MNQSTTPCSAVFLAGSATVDITPKGSVFLYGYPHVRRFSTGVHDPLECSALYLRDGNAGALFLANDLIFVPNLLVLEVRRRLRAATGIPEQAILIAATHTHSGPIVSDQLSNAADPVLPKADASYLAWLADRLVEAGTRAVAAAEPAEIGLSCARAEGVGGNRHDPHGVTDAEIPVLVARACASRRLLGCLTVYGMHPTVLHEDSTLISADFPYFYRVFLRKHILPAGCPVLYFNGAAGNQSPRHITRANTFSEAQRIGENLARSVADAIRDISFVNQAEIVVRHTHLDLERRTFPSIEEAKQSLEKAHARFTGLQQSSAAAATLRTAECDVFGAEETTELARAATDGRLAAAVTACTPAEIQVIVIGGWTFVAWPGEFFVEYGLALKAVSPRTFLVTLANGELQGYIVTPEAAARGCYEASNALFAAANGQRFVEATLELLQRREPTLPT